MLKPGVWGSNLLKCSREQIGIKRAKVRVRAAPARYKVIAPRAKVLKVLCAPHRSQKGHRSAGGANVLKLVARGARTKTAKVWRAPYVKCTPALDLETCTAHFSKRPTFQNTTRTTTNQSECSVISPERGAPRSGPRHPTSQERLGANA